MAVSSNLPDDASPNTILDMYMLFESTLGSAYNKLC